MKGSTRPVPVWMWFFAVMAISSFVGLLMYLDLYEKGQVSEPKAINFSKYFPPSNGPEATKEKQEPATTPEENNTADKSNTSFDFYSLLPKMEVLVPDHEVVTRATKAPLKQTPEEKGSYYLQAGAFKDYQSADRMKANLAFLGIESRIVSVTLDSGVWHRVRIGPFNDSDQLNKVKNIMQANSIRSILVKVNS